MKKELLEKLSKVTEVGSDIDYDERAKKFEKFEAMEHMSLRGKINLLCYETLNARTDMEQRIKHYEKHGMDDVVKEMLYKLEELTKEADLAFDILAGEEVKINE